MRSKATTFQIPDLQLVGAVQRFLPLPSLWFLCEIEFPDTSSKPLIENFLDGNLISGHRRPSAEHQQNLYLIILMLKGMAVHKIPTT